MFTLAWFDNRHNNHVKFCLFIGFLVVVSFVWGFCVWLVFLSCVPISLDHLHLCPAPPSNVSVADKLCFPSGPGHIRKWILPASPKACLANDLG